ncbi:polyamine-modulated factor 1-like, partial [Meleagris gallopavo]|uniref:polyamine-modulated factor 1-like n=1 Tax=Meleagris gallopavo TaxID=9103 RepID=UPI00093C3E3B
AVRCGGDGWVWAEGVGGTGWVVEPRGAVTPRRPSGIPEADARSTLVPFLLKQRCFLRRELSRSQEENRAAAAAVLQGRERIAALQRSIAELRAAWQDLPNPTAV